MMTKLWSLKRFVFTSSIKFCFLDFVGILGVLDFKVFDFYLGLFWGYFVWCFGTSRGVWKGDQFSI